MKLSPGKKKTLKFSLFLFGSLSLIIIVAGHQYLRASMPPMSGELELSGLRAPVSVIRDSSGIPHIEAQSTQDAFRALGYVMASERLFQMEVQRRLAGGELAEIFGEKALASDKFFRNLGLREHAQKLVQLKMHNHSFDPEMLLRAEAFFAGVNEYIASGKAPIEFTLLGLRAKEFSLVDAYSFVGLMGFSFGISTTVEPLLTSLVSRIGGDLVEDLRNEKIPAAQTRTVEALPKGFDTGKIISLITDLEKGFSLFEGSNGWLLSKERSASGGTILANDPHINFSQPGVWFEAHIKTPSYETYGHFLPVIPFPVLSHNRERGWGITMALTDDMDIYREVIDPVKKTYLFKGQQIPLEEKKEIIKVKGQKETEISVFKTRHGPILDHAIAEQSLALQWTFYSPENDALTTFYKMGEAKNVADFKKAVATGVSPALNILYADTENIGWWIFGEVWRKRPDLKTDFILDGSTGNDEIIGILPFSDKPSSLNPPSGLIVSANSRPFGYPADLRGDWQPADRYNTLESILSKKEKWSVPELMELQALNVNFENKILLQTLLAQLNFANLSEEREYKEYVDLLKNWNLASEVDSLAPSIYYSWCKEIQALLLKDLSVAEREILAKTPNGWIFLKRVILEENSAWWKKFDRQKIFREALVNSIADLKKTYGSHSKNWRWGSIHTLEFVHPLGRAKPLNYLFNQGPFEMPGALNEVNNQKYTALGVDYHITAGASTRRIIDFAHPEKSFGILPQGNSGHMLSPFYSNQVKLFAEGKYREQLLQVDEKSPSMRFKMSLVPKK